MPYAQAGDVRLHYESFGSGVPFLFVSGTGWPGEPWKLQQVPAFSDRYQVIVYDHRGVGKSDAPKGPYSTRQFAQDAIHLLDAIGVKIRPYHRPLHGRAGVPVDGHRSSDAGAQYDPSGVRFGINGTARLSARVDRECD